MNEQPQTMRERVMENAKSQATIQCRENYLASCIKHGGELEKIAIEVRAECVLLDSSGKVESI